MGRGAALRMGVDKAGRHIIAFFPADSEYHAANLTLVSPFVRTQAERSVSLKGFASQALAVRVARSDPLWPGSEAKYSITMR